MRGYLENRVIGVIAPAGFGKTEEIVCAVKESQGKSLVLTHTRAGVAALKERFQKYNIDKNCYEVTTIAAFCLKWCKAFPNSADISGDFFEKEIDYQKVYAGATKILSHEWAIRIFMRSYDTVFVDEYQDCVLTQHELFMSLSDFVPLRIYGDPLQGIFYWVKGDPLVKWNLFDFPIVEPLSIAWRWKKTNPQLGQILMDMRQCLLPTLSGQSCELSLKNVENSVAVIDFSTWNNGNFVYKIKKYKSIVFITTIEQKQNNFSLHRGGFFQSDEPKDLSKLKTQLLEIENLKGTEKALAWINIVRTGANSINTELKSYINKLEKGATDFTRIKKHENVGRCLQKLAEDGDPQATLDFINSIDEEGFKIYRKEFFYRIVKIYKYMIEENTSIEEAINLLENNNYRMEQRPKYSRLSSRTVLTKGLEFECVIVDAFDGMDARDFYVAVTRATKMVYVLTNNSTLHFEGITE